MKPLSIEERIKNEAKWSSQKVKRTASMIRMGTSNRSSSRDQRFFFGIRDEASFITERT